MASSRQIIGNTLVGSAHDASQDGKIPSDLAAIATTNYQEALTWLAFREEVNADQDYELTSNLSTHIDWPRSPISPELMQSLKTIVEQLLYLQCPQLDTLISTTFMKAAFKGYVKTLEQ